MPRTGNRTVGSNPTLSATYIIPVKPDSSRKVAEFCGFSVLIGLSMFLYCSHEYP
jgi:hypothetical protein